MATIKILLQGHSFIKRMKTFIRDTRPRYSYALNLSPAEFMVQYSGVSKGKIANLWRDSEVPDFTPDIVVLQCESNDLCDISVSPTMVCERLIEYCEQIINVNNVKHVVIMQIIHRLPPLYKIRYEVDTTWFNRVDETNTKLRQAASRNNKLTFFAHRGLNEHSVLAQAMTGDHQVST